VSVHLYDLPLCFVLAGLVLYVLLGGADFGAGWWTITAGRGEWGARVRGLAHDAIAPVWEANHVWLVFVLTVTWTAYPTFFGSAASTLSIALFIAAIGIVFRGALYALRTGTATPSEQRRVDTVFGISSVLTPFALGAAAGGIASGRVPVGNARGDLITSWLNPTSVTIGILAVATSAYMAAVFLTADAHRLGERELEDAFRRRALGSGLVAGAVAAVGVVVLHGDAHHLYHELVAGDGLPAVIVSALAGLATLALVWRRHVTLARGAAAVAVAGVIAGWALAQTPVLLPGLTVRQAAAPHDTLVAIVVAVIGGAVILFPSLGTLFRLVLRGRLDHAPPEQTPPRQREPVEPRNRALLARLAIGALVVGVGLVNVANSELAHGIGAGFFLAAAALGFRAALPLAADAPAAEA
jgi:cytochrome d ubiquinol oxidase subunit II